MFPFDLRETGKANWKTGNRAASVSSLVEKNYLINGSAWVMTQQSSKNEFTFPIINIIQPKIKPIRVCQISKEDEKGSHESLWFSISAASPGFLTVSICKALLFNFIVWKESGNRKWVPWGFVLFSNKEIVRERSRETERVKWHRERQAERERKREKEPWTVLLSKEVNKVKRLLNTFGK